MDNFIKFAVINYMEPLPEEGGRKWRAHQIASLLSNKGFKTALFTSSFSHFFGYQRGLKDRLIDNYFVKFCYSISYTRKSIFMRIISQLIFSISLMIKISIYKPNIIIASYPHSHSLIAISILKPFLRFKLLIDIRDSLNQPSNQFLIRIYNNLEKIFSYIWFYRSDKLFGPGEKVYKYLPKELQIKAKNKFHNIPMTYEMINKKMTSEQTKKYDFIFIGSLSKAFELDTFINYIKTRSKYNLIILGDGPLLENLKKDCIYNDNIKFYGQVDFKIIQSLAEKSKFGLMPYSNKNNRFAHHLTNKLAEYLSFGIIPLVPNHCLEMADFLKTNFCGEVYDPKHLYQFLDNLLDNKNKYSYTDLKFIHRKHLSYESLKDSINNLISSYI